MSFNKTNLQPGDIVKLRQGDLFLVTKNHIVTRKLCLPFNLYTSDLYVIPAVLYDEQYDIVEVYRIVDLSPGVIRDFTNYEFDIPPSYLHWFDIVKEHIVRCHSDSIIKCIYKRSKNIIDIF